MTGPVIPRPDFPAEAPIPAPDPRSGTARGRFAPSPTGPLHFGSVVTALASYLQVKSQGGSWLVRIEDVDRPRVVKGSAASILQTLENLGLFRDGPVVCQSERSELYRSAVEQLRRDGRLYPCSCTRQETGPGAGPGIDGAPVYPGTCRAGVRHPGRPVAWRFRVEPGEERFEDLLQGPVVQDVEATVGDFVVQRADGIWTYHLAVVVDDGEQGVTEIVRGGDLLDSTARQRQLQRALGLPRPACCHLPVAVDGNGCKLSKQTGAPPVDRLSPGYVLSLALDFLYHPLPRNMADAPPTDMLAWAVRSWDRRRIPPVRCRKIPAVPGFS